jgi:uncharacterized protein YjgD (DUF1641 family)
MSDDESPGTGTDGSGEPAGASEPVETGAEAGTERTENGSDATGEAATDPTGHEQLEAALEENPEAVATFVRRLDAVNELLDVLALGEEAMTDEMVVSLAGTGASLGELADTAAEPDTRDGLARLLSAVGAAERAEGAEPAPSTLSLVKSLRDDDVKQGLAYVIALAKAIGAGPGGPPGED